MSHNRTHINPTEIAQNALQKTLSGDELNQYMKAGFDLKQLPKSIREIELPLYRGDSRPPSEIFVDGFKAWGSHYDVPKHV